MLQNKETENNMTGKPGTTPREAAKDSPAERDSLEKFLSAHERMYETALAEVRAGEKTSHWMWYIFPQLRGLGESSYSYLYGIADLQQARAYLAHPALSAHLTEISQALLTLEGHDPEKIFGRMDAMKLRSSMTLFALVTEGDSVFHRVLQRYFGGVPDEKTIELLKKTGG